MEYYVYQALSAVALFCSVGGKLLINKHIVIGYWIWIFSNVAWIAVHWIQPYTNWWQVTMYIAYICLNIHSIYVRHKIERDKDKKEAELYEEWEGEEGT